MYKTRSCDTPRIRRHIPNANAKDVFRRQIPRNASCGVSPVRGFHSKSRDRSRGFPWRDALVHHGHKVGVLKSSCYSLLIAQLLVYCNKRKDRNNRQDKNRNNRIKGVRGSGSCYSSRAAHCTTETLRVVRLCIMSSYRCSFRTYHMLI